MFLQPLKHNARKDFFFHQLPILHLPFPSQPCGHKGSSISVNRIRSSIDPASYSIFQDTPSTGLNKASEPPNLAISGQFIQEILLLSVRKTLPSPVQAVQLPGNLTSSFLENFKINFLFQASLAALNPLTPDLGRRIQQIKSFIKRLVIVWLNSELYMMGLERSFQLKCQYGVQEPSEKSKEDTGRLSGPGGD